MPPTRFVPQRQPTFLEQLLGHLRQRGLLEGLLELNKPFASGAASGATLGLSDDPEFLSTLLSGAGGPVAALAQPLRPQPAQAAPSPLAEPLRGVGEALGSLVPLIAAGPVASALVSGAGTAAVAGRSGLMFGLPEVGRQVIAGEFDPSRLGREVVLGAAFGGPGGRLGRAGAAAGAELAFGASPGEAALSAGLAAIFGGEPVGRPHETPPTSPPVGAPPPVAKAPASRTSITVPETTPVGGPLDVRAPAASGGSFGFTKRGSGAPVAAAPSGPAIRAVPAPELQEPWRFVTARTGRLPFDPPKTQLEILKARGVTQDGRTTVEKFAQAPDNTLLEVIATGSPEAAKAAQTALATKTRSYVPDGAPVLSALSDEVRGIKIAPVEQGIADAKTQLNVMMTRLKGEGTDGATRATLLEEVFNEAAATQRRYAARGEAVPKELVADFVRRQGELIGRPIKFQSESHAFAAAQREVRSKARVEDIDAFLGSLPNHYKVSDSFEARLRADTEAYKRVLTESSTLRDLVKRDLEGPAPELQRALGDHGGRVVPAGRGLEIHVGGQKAGEFKTAAEAQQWFDELRGGAREPSSLQELQLLAHPRGQVVEHLGDDAIRITNQLTGESQILHGIDDAIAAVRTKPPLSATAPELLPFVDEVDRFVPLSNSMGVQRAAEASPSPICPTNFSEEIHRPQSLFEPLRVRSGGPPRLQEALEGRAAQQDVKSSFRRVRDGFERGSPIRKAAAQAAFNTRVAGATRKELRGAGGLTFENVGRGPSSDITKPEGSSFAFTQRLRHGKAVTPRDIVRERKAVIQLGPGLPGRATPRALVDHESAHAMWKYLDPDVKVEFTRLTTKHGIVHPELSSNMGPKQLYAGISGDDFDNENWAFFTADYLKRARKPTTPIGVTPQSAALMRDFFQRYGGKI